MKEHVLVKKIYYHDTDCGGVVYYANYLKHFEEGRTEFLVHAGIDLKQLSEQNVLFVVTRATLDYKAPARYQDSISIITRIGEIKRFSLTFVQEMVRDKGLLVKAAITLACVDSNFRPVGIPTALRNVVEPIS